MADDSHAFSYLPAERIALIPAYSGSGRLQVNAIQVAGDGSFTELATTQLPRGGWNVRTLSLEDHRFAVVSKGRIVEIVESADL